MITVLFHVRGTLIVISLTFYALNKVTCSHYTDFAKLYTEEG